MEGTLAAIRAGTRATVTGFVEDDEDAVRKILSLGIVPGDDVHVLSTWPSFVLELGTTTYALDTELARSVKVSTSG